MAADLKRKIRVTPLPASGFALRGQPIAKSFGVDPNSEITAPAKLLVVLRPVRHPVLGAYKRMATPIVELVRRAEPANLRGHDR